MQVVLLDLANGTNEVTDEDLRSELEAINGNTRLSEHYLQLARDLDVMEAKTPEEVYKTHLVEGRTPDGPAVDSARANLASTFVNAFVNAGFGADKLVTPDEAEGSSEVRFPLSFPCRADAGVPPVLTNYLLLQAVSFPDPPLLGLFPQASSRSWLNMHSHQHLACSRHVMS